MLNIIFALISSIAYSTDVIFGKLALNNMNMYIFTFILSLCYSFIGIILYTLNPSIINEYFNNKENKKIF